MAEDKDRPAELDEAERTVTEAGGRPVEVFYRESGRIQISFVIRRGGSDHGPYTYLWDRQEPLTLLRDFVLSQTPRVVAVERNNRAGK
jgi:hypothetical protein